MLCLLLHKPWMRIPGWLGWALLPKASGSFHFSLCGFSLSQGAPYSISSSCQNEFMFAKWMKPAWKVFLEELMKSPSCTRCPSHVATLRAAPNREMNRTKCAVLLRGTGRHWAAGTHWLWAMAPSIAHAICCSATLGSEVEFSCRSSSRK